MKIKIDRIEIIGGQVKFNIKSVDLEISTKEISEMNEFEDKKIEMIKPIKRNILYYTHDIDKVEIGNEIGKIEIKKGDMVEILPSENCVTNADTINYDEVVSGAKGIVLEVYPLDNKIKFSRGYNVQASWLKFISRKNGRKKS